MSQMAWLSAYFTNSRDLLAFKMDPEIFLSGRYYRGTRVGLEFGKLLTTVRALLLQMHAGTSRTQIEILFPPKHTCSRNQRNAQTSGSSCKI